MGGGRALLLQVAHPKVAAGVEQHSTYVSDPWGRLFRTIDVMAKLSFATPEVSAEQAALLKRMHKRVVGTTSDGEPYHALDPDLLLWVWATLCDTALLMLRARPTGLSREEREQYYEEWKLVAYACGVPEGVCPPTWADFEAYMRQVIAKDLRVTDAAREGRPRRDGAAAAVAAWLVGRGPESAGHHGHLPGEPAQGVRVRVGRKARSGSCNASSSSPRSPCGSRPGRSRGGLPLRRSPAKQAAAVPVAATPTARR